MAEIISEDTIVSKILEIRGRRVMLDRDLAKLYGVETKYLIRQVKRNIKRFPADFMYVLSPKEITNLRCQNVTSSWGGRRYPPYVFTQEGVAMLSSVLNSKQAIHANILIMRVFVRLRNNVLMQKELAFKLKELEDRIEEHDTDIRDIFEAIRHLMGLPSEHRKISGFTTKSDPAE